MNINRKTVVAFIIVLLIIGGAFLVISLASSSQDFFSTFKDTAEVEAYLFTQVSIDQTTIAEVQQLVQSGIWGSPECYASEGTSIRSVDEAAQNGSITCIVSTGRFWWYYSILFVFEEGILISITVDEIYRGL